MQKKKICFISYLDQDNLGVGYLASTLLRTNNFDILLIDIKETYPVIIENILEAEPLVVGFSIVFQAQLDIFNKLIKVLRENRIQCHFTAGGHYPSLRYEELMNLIPELDSVVLFEGEHTMTELAEKIRNNHEWKNIKGIAYKDNGMIKRNSLRPLEPDLDWFPLPVRRLFRPMLLGQKAVNLLAGRGCYYKCSFCSIQRFYAQPPGRVKRIRRPEFVAREMQLHFEQEGCTIFLFQDDDFPLNTSNSQNWIAEFCNQLEKKNLADKIMWKISCRVNEVDERTFSTLMSHGLIMIYLGIESGTVDGLKFMNKKITPKQSLNAVNTLKRIKLPYEFGFMLFDPFTTFESLQKNVDFLMELCGDGSASVGLSKMLALAGTDIEETLRYQNRLYGQPPYEDYKFPDPQMDKCYQWLYTIFSDWMHSDTGFFNSSRRMHLEVEIFRRLKADKDLAEDVTKEFYEIVSSANKFLLNTVSFVAKLINSAAVVNDRYTGLESMVTIKHNEYCNQLTVLSHKLEDIIAVY